MAYEKVRDSKLDNKYVEDASFNAVKSYEMALAELDAEGRVHGAAAARRRQDADAGDADADPRARCSSCRRPTTCSSQRVPGSGRVPTMTYKAAEIPLRYLHWDDARPRMEQIVAKYCKDDIGANAGNAILVTYTIEKNLDKIEEWANRLQGGQLRLDADGAEERGRARQAVARREVPEGRSAVRRQEVRRGGQAVRRDRRRDPHGEDADKALNNAAVAYENVKRYAAATRLYERIVNDYPNSKFVDDALFRTAVSYQKAFEFDARPVSYLRLAEDKRFAARRIAPTRSTTPPSSSRTIRTTPKAADLFKRYAADKAVKREDASEAFFRAGVNFEKLKDYDKANKTFNEYVKYLRQRSEGRERVLEALLPHRAERRSAPRQGARPMRSTRRSSRRARRCRRRASRRSIAAHAAFILTEEKLPAVEKAKIAGGGKQLAASIQAFKTNVGDMVGEYNKVHRLPARHLDAGRLLPHRLPVRDLLQGAAWRALSAGSQEVGRRGVRHLPRSDRTGGRGR